MTITVRPAGTADAAERRGITRVEFTVLDTNALATTFYAPREEAAPVRLGYTPVRLAERSGTPYALATGPEVAPRPISYPTAVGLTYGIPLGAMLAAGLVAPAFASAPGAGALLGIPLGLAFFGGAAAGYAYAGEPVRGVLVSAGGLGVVVGGLLVSGAVLAAAGISGQGAGFVLPLVGVPIIGAGLVAYHVWLLQDLHGVVERRNAWLGPGPR